LRNNLQKHIRKTNIKINKNKIENVRKYIDKLGKWSYNKLNKREEKLLKTLGGYSNEIVILPTKI